GFFTAPWKGLVMLFRFLTPHFLNDRVYQPGEIADLPSDFVPNGGMEPLDATAALAFYRAGPQPTPSTKVKPPETRWQSVPISGTNLRRYSLTGVGSEFGDDIVA